MDARNGEGRVRRVEGGACGTQHDWCCLSLHPLWCAWKKRRQCILAEYLGSVSWRNT